MTPLSGFTFTESAAMVGMVKDVICALLLAGAAGWFLMAWNQGKAGR